MVDEYKLPDPRKRPADFLVILYKVLKKIEYDDRVWDKTYFARCTKRTKELLEVMDGDVQAAAKCLQDLKERFEADDMRWTIETVIGYSFEWKTEHQKKSERDLMKRFLGDFAKKAGGDLKRADVTGLLDHIKNAGATPMLDSGDEK